MGRVGVGAAEGQARRRAGPGPDDRTPRVLGAAVAEQHVRHGRVMRVRKAERRLAEGIGLASRRVDDGAARREGRRALDRLHEQVRDAGELIQANLVARGADLPLVLRRLALDDLRAGVAPDRSGHRRDRRRAGGDGLIQRLVVRGADAVGRMAAEAAEGRWTKDGVRRERADAGRKRRVGVGDAVRHEEGHRVLRVPGAWIPADRVGLRVVGDLQAGGVVRARQPVPPALLRVAYLAAEAVQVEGPRAFPLVADDRRLRAVKSPAGGFAAALRRGGRRRA